MSWMLWGWFQEAALLGAFCGLWGSLGALVGLRLGRRDGKPLKAAAQGFALSWIVFVGAMAVSVLLSMTAYR